MESTKWDEETMERSGNVGIVLGWPRETHSWSWYFFWERAFFWPNDDVQFLLPGDGSNNGFVLYAKIIAEYLEPWHQADVNINYFSLGSLYHFCDYSLSYFPSHLNLASCVVIPFHSMDDEKWKMKTQVFSFQNFLALLMVPRLMTSKDFETSKYCAPRRW